MRYFMEASTYYTQNINETVYDVPSQILWESPESKIIYIIRNPFERLVSNYYHVKRKGDSRSFEEISNHTWCINTCLYYDRIQPFINKFGQDRVHILTLENLKLSPKNELKRVYDFLDLPDHKEVKLDIHNVTSPKHEKPKFNIVTYDKLYHLFLRQEELLNNNLGMNIKWNLSKKPWLHS